MPAAQHPITRATPNHGRLAKACRARCLHGGCLFVWRAITLPAEEVLRSGGNCFPGKESPKAASAASNAPFCGICCHWLSKSKSAEFRTLLELNAPPEKSRICTHPRDNRDNRDNRPRRLSQSSQSSQAGYERNCFFEREKVIIFLLLLKCDNRDNRERTGCAMPPFCPTGFREATHSRAGVLLCLWLYSGNRAREFLPLAQT